MVTQNKLSGTSLCIWSDTIDSGKRKSQACGMIQVTGDWSEVASSTKLWVRFHSLLLPIKLYRHLNGASTGSGFVREWNGLKRRCPVEWSSHLLCGRTFITHTKIRSVQNTVIQSLEMAQQVKALCCRARWTLVRFLSHKWWEIVTDSSKLSFDSYVRSLACVYPAIHTQNLNVIVVVWVG